MTPTKKGKQIEKKVEEFNSKDLFNAGKYGDVVKKLWCPSCKKITTFTEWLTAPGGYLKGVVCDSCGDNRQQKQPPYYRCHAYKAKCKCGKKYVLLTQDDDRPEYHTSIGIVCDCGEAVFINLPVN